MSNYYAGRQLAGKKGTCPVCKEKLQLMLSGMLPAHGIGWVKCSGSGKIPQAGR